MTQLIDLGKLRFYFAGDWHQSTAYESNDIVKYGGNVYVYTFALKTAGVLPTVATHWALMIEGFRFQGEFDTAINYKIGDTVAHGGVVYVAIKDSFNITPPNPTFWSRFLDGIQFEGDFDPTEFYQKNDVVKYGGSLYVAKQDTTTNLPTNTTFWDKFVEGVSPQGVYNEATNYVPNDLVAYGANIYRAKTETTDNPPSDTNFWELYVGGIKFLGEYDPVNEYYVNDLVIYGNILYRSRETQTDVIPTDQNGWELLVGGVNFAGEFNEETEYYINDIVVYGNNSYRSLVTQTGVVPTESSDWELYASTTNYRGTYSNANTYFQGDLVNYGGNVYLALEETSGNVPTDTQYWSVFSAGFSFQGEWSSSTQYFVAQVVNYGGSLYQAIEDNVNTNPTDASKWEKIVPGFKVDGPWETAKEYATDVVVTYGGNTFISILPHASVDFNDDLAAGRWQKFNSGIRFTGAWNSQTQYFKDDIVKAGSSSFIASEDILGGPDPAGGTSEVWVPFATGAEGFLSKDGDAMLGFLTLFADPVDPLHAATKQYVDLFINAADGGTILGPLVADGANASYTAINGATINIEGGSLNLANGSTLSIDGSSTIGEVTVDGNINLNGGNLETNQESIDVFNTVANTVNAFGDATEINIGAATGVTTVNHDLDVVGDLDIDGGDLTTTQLTFNLLNSSANTVNAFGDATQINIGDADGLTTLAGDLEVQGDDLTTNKIEFNLLNTVANTVNAFGDATAINIGAATGVTTLNHNLDVVGDVDIDGGDLTTTQLTFNLLNSSANTVNAFGDATEINIGNAAGILNVRNEFVVLDGELDTGTSGTTYTNTSLDPTGFDNNHPTTRGVIEFSDNGTRVYSIDKDGVSTQRDDSTFATGTSYEVAAAAKTLVIFPAPSQDNFTYYINGVRYETTTLKTLSLANNATEYAYFYFDGSTLASTATRNDALLITKANVASLYISPSNERITFIADERHGISIDGDTLAYTIGTDQLQVESGFGLTATAGDEEYVSTAAGVLRNADIRIDVPIKATNKFISRFGNEWRLADFGDDLLSNQLGVLDSVTVTDGGSGYQGATTTAAVVGDGEDATVELGFDEAPIASVTLADGGYDYDSNTTMTVVGDGAGALVTVDIPAGFNIAKQESGGLVLTNQGNGYTDPIITVVNDEGDTTGTGAVISYALDLGTPVALIEMIALGSGYSQANTTAVISGDGAGATATVTVTAGAVTDIDIVDGGSGYTFATVEIIGAGTGAEATVFTLKNEIVDYLITDVGSGYTSATVEILGDGNGATATAQVTAGGVTDIVITNGGRNYTFATMVISGDGTGATAEPRLSGYPIASISFADDNARGKNYTLNPTVTIVENGFGIVKDGGSPNSPAAPAPAEITTALSNGNTIEAINLTEPGSGYTTATLEIDNIGDGNGAVFSLETEPSSILSVTVTDSGRQYSFADIVVTSPTGSGATFETTLVPVPQYNQFVGGNTGYDLNNIPAGKFTITYFVAISGVDNVLKIPSEYIFDSVVEAYIKATPEIQEIREFGLPFNKYEFLGFSIINNLGEAVTMPDTNQGSVVYYDLTDPVATNLVEDTAGPVGIAGRSLTVGPSGTNALWLGATESDKVFYVASHGEDVPHAGRNISAPFASINYACSQAEEGSTIFVRTGTYFEQLPIVVPDSVAIVGDNQRTTIVRPAEGFETDTMWKLSNGSILNKMTFKGITGWVPADSPNQDDISQSTPAGIVIGLNEDSPIITKSPYVVECSYIGTGGIGAYVDGDVHTTGNKSMLFHAYTVISDNGVGYWVDNGGLSEIVSCFTYYCTFGYATTAGAKIRALNGNNSYGKFGAVSTGFDEDEVPVTGTILGEQLNFVYEGGNIVAGDTVTDSVTGATAIVTNVQFSASKLYIKDRDGTFETPNELSFSSGGTGVVASGEVEGQKGFTLIINNLTDLPRPGGSIELSDDSISYVIQSVSGTYANTDSEMVIVLAQEKPTPSSPGADVTIRYNFSQARLTGHDFLLIGTGGFVSSNHPGEPLQPPAPGNEVREDFPGRVFFVSTDQDGNFRVGEFFKIEQATGTATLNANAFNLAGLTSLRLGSIGAQLGETINEFSADATLAGNSNSAVPTEFAVKTYVDTELFGPDSIIAYKIVTSNINVPVQSYIKYLVISTAAYTLTLPEDPVDGSVVIVADGSNFTSFNTTIARNGKTIGGLAENLILDVSGSKVEMVYYNNDWKVFII